MSEGRYINLNNIWKYARTATSSKSIGRKLDIKYRLLKCGDAKEVKIRDADGNLVYRILQTTSQSEEDVATRIFPDGSRKKMTNPKQSIELAVSYWSKRK